MDVLEHMYLLRGRIIRFKTYEGVYEGTVKSVYPESKQVCIDDAIFLPDRIHMGKLFFLAHEFDSYLEIGLPSREHLSNMLDCYDSSRRYNISVKSTAAGYNLADLSDDDESCTGESINVENSVIDDDYIIKLPENFSGRLPVDLEVFDSINSDFLQAIKRISEEHMIGVSFEGPKIDRHGNLSWICISIPSCTFLFDVESMKIDVFDKGLKEIFENRKIEKVIHDCRQSADCLFHLFNTNLVNVFDTQVADYMINMQKKRGPELFTSVNSLDACLSHYLSVPEEFLYDRGQDDSFYSLRPVSHEFQDFAIKNTIYLLHLKQVLFSLLMSPYYRAVNVYLQVLTDASEEELLLEPSVPDEVPFALLMEGIQTVSFRNHDEMPPATSSVSPCRQKGSRRKRFLPTFRKLNFQNEEGTVVNTELKNGFGETPAPGNEYNITGRCETQKIHNMCGDYQLMSSSGITNASCKSYFDRNPEKSNLDFQHMKRNMSNVVCGIKSKSVEGKNLTKTEPTAGSISVSSEENETFYQQDLTTKNKEDSDDKVDIWAKLRSATHEVLNDEAKKESEAMKYIVIPAGMQKHSFPISKH